MRRAFLERVFSGGGTFSRLNIELFTQRLQKDTAATLSTKNLRASSNQLASIANDPSNLIHPFLIVSLRSTGLALFRWYYPLYIIIFFSFKFAPVAFCCYKSLFDLYAVMLLA
jgi:hypothetical protein